MPPKKGKKKRAAADPIDYKVFEQELAELNRMLAASRAKNALLVAANEELLAAKQKIHADGDDIIAYLTRTTQEHHVQLAALQAEAQRVTKARESAMVAFEDAKQSRMNQFRITEEQLTSDKRLLVGKMHALEEFRIQRDELMTKCERLEEAEVEQMVRHKREIYACERQYIIGKDKLKKEMDARLEWLIDKFQAVSHLRVAATSLRVIRENIALNNQLHATLRFLCRLCETNEALRVADREMMHLATMSQAEAHECARHVHDRLVELVRLVNEYYEMLRHVQAFKHLVPMLRDLEAAKEQQKRAIADCQRQKSALEQQLHEGRCLRCDIAAEQRAAEVQDQTLMEFVQRAKAMVTAMRSERHDSPEGQDAAEVCASRLEELFALLQSACEYKRTEVAVDTMVKRDDIYMRGKVGLVPRKVVLKSMEPTMEHRSEAVRSSMLDLASDERDGQLEDEADVEVEEEEAAADSAEFDYSADTLSMTNERETQTEGEDVGEEESYGIAD